MKNVLGYHKIGDEEWVVLEGGDQIPLREYNKWKAEQEKLEARKAALPAGVQAAYPLSDLTLPGVATIKID